MYSFLIVSFPGIAFALLAQAICRDFIFLAAFSVVLLAFSSNLCNDVCLFPKRGLFKLIDDFQLVFLGDDDAISLR